MSLVAEIEADDGVGDPGRAPPGYKHVGAAQLRQVIGTGLPLAGVVGFTAVNTVAKVVNSDLISVYIGVGGLRVVRLPVGGVGGLQSKPPDSNQGEAGKRDHHSRIAPAQH